jgi:hypothetical protein
MCIPFLFTTAMIAKLQLNQKRQIDTHCTQIHDRSLCWIDTDSSIKIDWVKLVFVCAQTCPLCEKICSCKCFPHVSKMPTLTSELNIRCVRSGIMIINFKPTLTILHAAVICCEN